MACTAMLLSSELTTAQLEYVRALVREVLEARLAASRERMAEADPEPTPDANEAWRGCTGRTECPK